MDDVSVEVMMPQYGNMHHSARSRSAGPLAWLRGYGLHDARLRPCTTSRHTDLKRLSGTSSPGATLTRPRLMY